MTYEKPEINVLGAAASVILGPQHNGEFDNPGVTTTTPGDLVLGLDD